jgi:S-adenosylmethionine-diacylgycerolhomoserine-N-methlytransferase
MSTPGEDTFKAMDRMYRLQRYFYDITRKYYLLGRDRLLRELEPQPDERILEVGCGTARNLIALSTRSPRSKLYGLDASNAMLETAAAKIRSSGARNIELAAALADTFDHASTFGEQQPFDKIFFSYSISMIPTWQRSIEKALENLRPGGTLYIVDFYDQAELPTAFSRLLKWWLLQFHVKFWDGLIPYLESIEHDGRVTVTVRTLYRRYAFMAAITKA